MKHDKFFSSFLILFDTYSGTSMAVILNICRLICLFVYDANIRRLRYLHISICLHDFSITDLNSLQCSDFFFLLASFLFSLFLSSFLLQSIDFFLYLCILTLLFFIEKETHFYHKVKKNVIEISLVHLNAISVVVLRTKS